MNKGDELLDFILDIDGRQPAIPKPRYFWGDRFNYDLENYRHNEKLPVEQFWNQEEAEKNE